MQSLMPIRLLSPVMAQNWFVKLILSRHLPWSKQSEQLGTGHAVKCALGELRDQAKVIILYGDVPLITPTTISKMLAAVDNDHISLLTIELPNPSGYGRIIRDNQGQIEAIVEQKDASHEQLESLK